MPPDCGYFQADRKCLGSPVFNRCCIIKTVTRYSYQENRFLSSQYSSTLIQCLTCWMIGDYKPQMDQYDISMFNDRNQKDVTYLITQHSHIVWIVISALPTDGHTWPDLTTAHESSCLQRDNKVLPNVTKNTCL